MSFRQSPLNTVDVLIFCQLSYLPFDNIVPPPNQNTSVSISDASHIFAVKHKKNALDGYVLFKEDPKFIDCLGQSNRYKDCKLYNYVNHIDEAQEKQFSAICINTETETFIAYRGTDVSFVGWKEDFNMSYTAIVPSQLEAVSYLEDAVKKIKGPLIIGGHSKGGNLAVYAASSCKEKARKRIQSIYALDAPGFHSHLIASDGFREIFDRINLYIPQSSVVGMLFEHGKDSTIIKSAQYGLMQHDLYSWEVTHNDLVKLDYLTQSSRFMDKTLREWIGGMDYKHRREFSEALFEIFNATEAKSLVGLGSDWFKAAGKMIQNLGNIDNSTKKIVRRTINALFKAASHNINTLLKVQKTSKTKKDKAAINYKREP